MKTGLILILLAASASFAADVPSYDFLTGLNRLATRVKSIVKDERVDVAPISIRVGNEVLSEDLALTHSLLQALQKQQVYLFRSRGNLHIETFISPRRDLVTEALTGATLTVDISTADGKPFRSFSQIIENQLDTALLLGLSGDLRLDQNGNPSPEAPTFNRNKRPVTDGAALFSGQGSPFGVQVGVLDQRSNEYVTRPIRVREGLPFVEMHPNDIYAISVINRAPSETAVSVFIDGLNMFHFQKGTRLSKMVVGSGSFQRPAIATFEGWFIDNYTATQFRVRPYEQSSAAAEGVDARKAGIISVIFHSTNRGAPRGKYYAPYSQPAWAEGRGPQVGAGLGTDQGDKIHQTSQATDVKAGFAEAIVSIRYFAE